MTDDTFDPIWEKKYVNNHVQRAPWDVVVSFVFRNIPKNKLRNDVHILEVGCGTASNLWFLAREGFRVAGVDMSHSAIEYAKQRFQKEDLIGDLRTEDFTQLTFKDNSFDLVIDRASLSCTGRSHAKKAVNEIHRVLKPGGRFLFNPYSDRHSSSFSGQYGSDGVKVDISEGSLIGAGQICFYGRNQIENLLCNDFKIISMQHVQRMEMTCPKILINADWQVVAEAYNK